MLVAVPKWVWRRACHCRTMQQMHHASPYAATCAGLGSWSSGGDRAMGRGRWGESNFVAALLNVKSSTGLFLASQYDTCGTRLQFSPSLKPQPESESDCARNQGFDPRVPRDRSLRIWDHMTICSVRGRFQGPWSVVRTCIPQPESGTPFVLVTFVLVPQ